jgi:hypothetical protein
VMLFPQDELRLTSRWNSAQPVCLGEEMGVAL